MKRLDLYLPPALFATVTKTAKRHGVNKRDIVHAALEKSLADLTTAECQAVQIRGRRGDGPRKKNEIIPE